jgi:hypothetical protein
MLDDAHADPIEYVGFHGAAATMAAELGHMALAQDHASRAVEIGRQSTRPWYGSLALYAFGRAWWQTKPEAALAALQECTSVQTAVGAAVEARALALTAQLHAGMGDNPAAVEALREAIARAHADGDRPSMAATFARGTRVMHAAGDHEAAALFSGAVARGVLAKLYALPRPERASHRELLDSVRSKLGSEAYDTSTSRGAAMAYDELVTFALQRLEIALAR